MFTTDPAFTTDTQTDLGFSWTEKFARYNIQNMKNKIRINRNSTFLFNLKPRYKAPGEFRVEIRMIVHSD